MKILLINSNPVVSRLTALSARKEEIQIDEVQEVQEVSNSHYDIIFVDADSWSKELDSVISKNIKTQKRVLFYAQEDKNTKELFDISILKPFLPSEVSAVIRSVEESESINNIDIVSSSKDDKKDDFLESLDDTLDLEDKSTTLIPEKSAESKVKLDNKDEDIFAELKDNTKTFDETLEEAFPLKKLEPETEDLFELDLSSEKLDDEFMVLEKDKKVDLKTDNSELFDFDLDSNDEVDFNLDTLTDKKDTTIEKIKTVEKKDVKEVLEIEKVEPKDIEPKIETKILDKDELSNIKNILENDNPSTESLDELLSLQPATANLTENIKKEKKKKEKVPEISPVIDSEILANTLVSMPVESLRVLLAGATVKIHIKFPKAK